MLSPEVQRRLEDAREKECGYTPKPDIVRQLGEKTLIMLIAPAATGKTRVMREAETLDPEFGQVPIFSTRDPRDDDDPAMFRISPHDDTSVSELLDRIDRREVVQYVIHPTQGRIYGTDPEDYASPYNMLATLSGGVEAFRQLPFMSTHAIGLTAEPATWASWFNSRYPVSTADRQKRLQEALLSLDWLLDERQRSSVSFVKNVEGEPYVPAQMIINSARGEENDSGSDARSQAYGMRVWANGALDALKERINNYE